MSWKDLLTAKGRSIVRSADTSVIFPWRGRSGWNVDWNSVEKIDVRNIFCDISHLSQNSFVAGADGQYYKNIFSKRKIFQRLVYRNFALPNFAILTLLQLALENGVKNS